MTRRAFSSVLTTAVAAVLLAGCGSDTPASPPGSKDNPMVAQTPQPGQPAAREPGSTDGKATKLGFNRLLKRQSGHPSSRFTPCLVTRSQAHAIVGKQMQLPFEAPQGPTCIYRAAKGSGLVTVAVQQAEFKQVVRRLQQPTKVKVASRTGVCGQYGQPTLYVPVSNGRVLTIAAPCGVAKRFAAQAVRTLDR